MFIALTTIEAYLVAPTILGRTFRLNLIAVFLSLFFWGWMWGPAGVLLAVPMLATLKIISDHVAGIARVLFTVDRRTMVLLHGFVKKSQKTPAADLKTAKRRLADLRKAGR